MTVHPRALDYTDSFLDRPIPHEAELTTGIRRVHDFLTVPFAGVIRDVRVHPVVRHGYRDHGRVHRCGTAAGSASADCRRCARNPAENPLVEPMGRPPGERESRQEAESSPLR